MPEAGHRVASPIEPPAANGPRPDMQNDDNGGGSGRETPDSAAHYIAAMTGELAKMARRNGLDTLCYILEMAWLEADQIAKD